MRDYIEEACDQIDSAIFSGDAFIEPEARKELRGMMARWERGLKEHEETFPNGPEEEPNES